ncbi:MAG: hypothetical protein ACC645_22875, partial [Pirellulales bacterium]
MVTIPAGRSFVDFPIATINDFTSAGSVDPTETYAIKVDDGPGGLTEAIGFVEVMDNEGLFVLYLAEDIIDEGTLQDENIPFDVTLRRPFIGEPVPASNAPGSVTPRVTATPGGTAGPVWTPCGGRCASGGIGFRDTDQSSSKGYWTLANSITEETEVLFTFTPQGGVIDSGQLFVRNIGGDGSLEVEFEANNAAAISEDGGTTVLKVTRPAQSGIATALSVTVTSSDPTEAMILDPNTNTPSASAIITIPAFASEQTVTVIGVHDTDAPIDPATGQRLTWVDADFDLDDDNGQWVTIYAIDNTRRFNRGAERIKVTDADVPNLELNIYERLPDPDNPRGPQILSLSEDAGDRAAIGEVLITNLEQRTQRTIWGDPFVSQPIKVFLNAVDTANPSNPVSVLGDELNVFGGSVFTSIPNMGEVVDRTELIIPAGATSATFDIDALDDFLPDGDQAVTLTASAVGTVDNRAMGSAITSLTVTDVRPFLGDVVVEVVKVEMDEGTTIAGPTAGLFEVRVGRTGDTRRDLDLQIRARDAYRSLETGELTINNPSAPRVSPVATRTWITIPAGRSSVTDVFRITAIDERITINGVAISLADGTQSVLFDVTDAILVDRSSPNQQEFQVISSLIAETDSLDVLDVGVPRLFVSVEPNSFDEDAGVRAAQGTVFRNTPLNRDQVVYLVSSDASEARVPTSVTISAGQLFTTFPVDAIDEFISDDPQDVTIIGTSPGVFSSSDVVRVFPAENFEIYNRHGDRNLDRDQGQLLIESNVIRDVAEFGIAVNAGTRAVGNSLPFAGPVRSTPT